jgi:hypothetical protein
VTQKIKIGMPRNKKRLILDYSKPCRNCKLLPCCYIRNYSLCRECYNKKEIARIRAWKRKLKNRPPEPRICVHCFEVFISIGAVNFCMACFHLFQDMAFAKRYGGRVFETVHWRRPERMAARIMKEVHPRVSLRTARPAIAPPRDLSPLKIEGAWKKTERDLAALKAADDKRRPDFAAIQASRVHYPPTFD